MGKKKKKSKKKNKKKKETKKKAKKTVKKVVKNEKKADMIAEAITQSKISDKLLKLYETYPEKILNDVKSTRNDDPLMDESQKTRENAVQVYIKETANHKALIQFPVVPQSFEVQSGQNNQTLIINQAGEVNLPGKRALRVIELQSFFPNQDYNFLVCERKSDPYTYIRWMEKRKREGTVLRVIITGTGVNMACLIDDLRYGEDDATGDVNFTVTLKEYRTLKVTRENKTSSGGTTKKKTDSNIYITKKGDTIKKIAKKMLGSASKGKKLYKKNKKAIEKAFKKWIKEENKRRKKAGKKKLKWKNSKKGKHLAPGTRIVLK